MAESRNFHVISGGPGSGKTSMIEMLRHRGYRCVDEAGRDIIRQQARIGGPGVHDNDRALYCELMLSRMIHDYDALDGHAAPVFFDRGIGGLIGYCRLTGMAVPAHLRQAAAVFRYNPAVFITPPWPEIYHADSERKQDFAEAVRTFEAVVAGYHESGYRVIEVPKTSVAARVDFLLGQIAEGTG